MIRTFKEIIEPTPIELAVSFWNMDASDQVEALHALYHRFCILPVAGGDQLASIRQELETKPAEYKAEVREFVTKFYDFLKEG